MPTAPTLINLPPPPSDTLTPSDLPPSGTPNSTITTLSELSTVAIKDGHRGHTSHTSRNQPHPDAERADRISRLAGLERVNLGAGAGGNRGASSQAGSGLYLSAASAIALASGTAGHGHGGAQQGYFDAGQSQSIKQRSTCGSASATTASIGGQTTTWATGSAVSGMSDGDTTAAERDVSLDDEGDDGERMEDMELDRRSDMGNASDDGTAASLVGFGEGARTPARNSVNVQAGRSNFARAGGSVSGSDAGSVDALGAMKSGNTPTNSQVAERILKDRLGDSDGTFVNSPTKTKGSASLGRFDFEGK